MAASPAAEPAPKLAPPPPPDVNVESPAKTPARRPEQSSVDPEIVCIPSYSKWFSWDDIHECEVRYLPEFFGDAPSPLKNPKVYLYYRNSIISKFRQRPSRRLTFTEARKTIIGDVGAIRRVFDFLETWGLVNYNGASVKQPLKWEDKESRAAGGAGQASQNSENLVGTGDAFSSKRWCSVCKALCSIACFTSDKYNLTLCARCYVRGNYRAGIQSSDFRRVEINEETKSNWSDKETLHLLEAIFHYGDDWKRVAEHVGGGRTEKDCVARFIKLPIGQELVRQPGPEEFDNIGEQDFDPDCDETSTPMKRMRLTPLADASNPVMAQAAFLSALAGAKVAESAAQAAVAALSDGNYVVARRSAGTLSNNAMSKAADITSNGDKTSGSGLADVVHGSVNSALEKEQKDVERAILSITDVQMKQIHENIEEFEEFDLHVEKERKRLQQMKDLLFADQLSLKFHKPNAPSTDQAIVNSD
uniref:SWI/SNF complex subunit SWI3B n=1 Tax=Kalanchoe fedtschenkoi TaxID=63787 RepID=A0A7N0ZVI8_KALFE